METPVQQIVTHYFETRGVSLEQLKEDAKKKKIIYSRFVRPAKQVLELAGTVELAKAAITKVANWAKSRNLDYTIETVLKRWLDLENLKPKEKKRVPYYRGDRMVYNEAKKMWFVIDKRGDWLEFADKESKIDWVIE